MSNRKTILIIDDQPENLFILEEIIKEYLPQLSIVSALGAKEGRAKATPEVSIVIADVQMPEMNGIELCRKIKANPATSHLPVLLITAHQSSPALRVQGLEAGAMDFISRPIDTEELVAKIKVALDVRSHHEALTREKASLGKVLQIAESQYRILLDNAAEIILIANLDGDIVQANAEAARILKYPKEILSRMKVSELVPPENTPIPLADAELTRTTTTTTQFARSDGSLLHVEARSKLVDLGNAYVVWIMAQDISERKWAEKALRESENRFRLLFQNAPLPYQSLNETGHFLSVNAKWLAALGYEEAEVLGSWFGDYLVPEQRELFEERFPMFKDACVIDGAEFNMVRKDGSVIIVSFNGRVQLDDKGNFLRTHCIFTDVTSKKRQEEELLKESRLNKALALTASELVRTDSTMESIAKTVHLQASELTGSQYCYVATIDPQTGEMLVHTLSAMLSEELCQVGPNKRIAFPKGPEGYGGLWGICLNTREPFLTNAPANEPAASGLPKGHVPVEQFLAVPALHKGGLMGCIALANPQRDYTEEDVHIVTALTDLYAEGIARFRLEEEITKKRSREGK